MQTVGYRWKHLFLAMTAGYKITTKVRMCKAMVFIQYVVDTDPAWVDTHPVDIIVVASLNGQGSQMFCLAVSGVQPAMSHRG